MPSLFRVASDLDAVSDIAPRRDFERWHQRSRHRRRFLLTAYLIGAIPVMLAGVVTVTAASINNWDQLHSIEPILVGSLGALLGGACCGGPLILIPCGLLLFTGLSSYKKTIAELKRLNRVCDVCGCVSMFDDKYVNPSKRKGHTSADLVPHMNAIEEDGKTHVVCDACLADLKAIEKP